MADLTVAMTYGEALFQAATDLGLTDEVRNELKGITEIFEKTPEFYDFLKAGNIRAKEKKQILDKAFEGRVCAAVKNFLYVLVDKGRIGSFTQILKEYEKLLNHADGCASGSIISAQPLKPEQLARFEEETSKLLRQKVRLEPEVDISLIGGVKILVEGKLIDTSIRTRLAEMADALK